MTESVDANGNKTIRTYNGLGSLVQERYADGGRTDYKVDVFGQRVQMTQVAIDIQNIVTNFSYDRKGNVVDRWFENVSLGEVIGDMSTNGYAGDMHEVSRYDEMGRRVAMLNYVSRRVSGQLQALSAAEVAERFKYDSANNLLV